MTKKMHRLEIHKNSEGDTLAYMEPANEDNGGYRIAGPKGWGGTKEIASIEISENDLVAYIKDYAPNVIKLLK